MKKLCFLFVSFILCSSLSAQVTDDLSSDANRKTLTSLNGKFTVEITFDADGNIKAAALGKSYTDKDPNAAIKSYGKKSLVITVLGNDYTITPDADNVNYKTVMVEEEDALITSTTNNQKTLTSLNGKFTIDVTYDVKGNIKAAALGKSYTDKDPKASVKFYDKKNFVITVLGGYYTITPDLDKGNYTTIGTEAVTYKDRGDAECDKDNYAGVIDAYTKAIELNPNYIEAYSNRGFMEYEYKEYGVALKDFNKVIELDPKNANAYTYRGLIEYKQHEYASAIKDYNSAIACDPKNAAGAYNMLGDLKYVQGLYAEAITAYTNALNLNQLVPARSAIVYCNRGDVKFTNKDYAGAFADYEKAIGLDPQNSNAYLGRGNVRSYNKDYAGARTDYVKAIMCDPQNTMAQLFLQAAQLKLNDEKEKVWDTGTSTLTTETLFSQNWKLTIEVTYDADGNIKAAALGRSYTDKDPNAAVISYDKKSFIITVLGSDYTIIPDANNINYATVKN